MNETPTNGAHAIEAKLLDAILTDLTAAGLAIVPETSLERLLLVAEAVEISSDFSQCEKVADWAVSQIAKNSVAEFKKIPYAGSPVPDDYALDSYWEEFKFQVQRASDSTTFDLYVEMVRTISDCKVGELSEAGKMFIAKFSLFEDDANGMVVEEAVYNEILETAGFEELVRDPEDENEGDEEE